MKKTTFLTVGLFVISFGPLYAQTNQGNFLLGLSSDIFSLGYSTSKISSDNDEAENAGKSFSVNLSPNMGYFVIDNLAIGLGLGVGFTAYNNESGDFKTSAISTSLSAGPFIRYYIPVSKVLPFCELSGSYGWSNMNISGTNLDDTRVNIGTFNYGGGIGLAAPLGERVMADVMLGYRSLNMKYSQEEEYDQTTKTGTLGLSIGFVILLGSK
jgi:outer membrane protein